jgi:hypothetical protein
VTVLARVPPYAGLAARHGLARGFPLGGDGSRKASHNPYGQRPAGSTRFVEPP